jgi:hypothetical protein
MLLADVIAVVLISFYLFKNFLSNKLPKQTAKELAIAVPD